MPSKLEQAKAKARAKIQERKRLSLLKNKGKAKNGNKRVRDASPDSYVSTSPKKSRTIKPSPVRSGVPLHGLTAKSGPKVEEQFSANQPFKVTISHEPTTFQSGSFGYKAYLRRLTFVDGKDMVVQMNSNIIVGNSAITSTWFMANARPLKIKIDAQPKIFATGQRGWHCRSTLKNYLKDCLLAMDLTFNATVHEVNSFQPAPAKKGEDGWGMEVQKPEPAVVLKPEVIMPEVAPMPRAVETLRPEQPEIFHTEVAEQPSPVSDPISEKLSFTPALEYDDRTRISRDDITPAAVSHPAPVTNSTSTHPSVPALTAHADTQPKGSSVCQMCGKGLQTLFSIFSMFIVVVALLLLLYGPERTLEMGKAAEKLIPDGPLNLLLETLGIGGDAADGASNPEL